MPIVVTGLNKKLQLSWSPSHLIQDHGEDICYLEDCEEKEMPTKKCLRAFLTLFMGIETGDAQDILPSAIWRIKVQDLFLH
jgi:hypothetical protein